MMSQGYYLPEAADDSFFAVITGGVKPAYGLFADLWIYHFWQVMRNPGTGEYLKIDGGKFGNYQAPIASNGAGEKVSIPAVEVNNQEVAIGTIVEMKLITLRGVTAYEFQVGGGDNSFLVVLTAKDCPAALDSPTFIAYSGVHVLDSGNLTYTLTDQTYGPANTSEDNGFPIYHQQNTNLPVWPGYYNFTVGDTVPEECVVRVRKGSGDYYLIEQDPRMDIVRKRVPAETATVGGIEYTVADLMRYDEASNSLKKVKKVYLLEITNLSVTP